MSLAMDILGKYQTGTADRQKLQISLDTKVHTSVKRAAKTQRVSLSDFMQASAELMLKEIRAAEKAATQEATATPADDESSTTPSDTGKSKGAQRQRSASRRGGNAPKRSSSRGSADASDRQEPETANAGADDDQRGDPAKEETALNNPDPDW